MNILQRPIVTEKAMASAKAQYYGFIVDGSATKYQIKAMVEKLYKVHVVAVKTTVNPGKTKRVGKMRRSIVTSSAKKAFVKLAKDQSLDIIPTMPKEDVKK